VSTAFFEKFDDFVVVKSENDVGDDNLLNFHSAVYCLFAICFELTVFFLDFLKSLVKNLFELSFHMLLKVRNKRFAISAILIVGSGVIFKIIPHGLSDFKLHSVITWGNSLQVPLQLR